MTPFSFASSFSLHLCSHRLLHPTFYVSESLELGSHAVGGPWNSVLWEHRAPAGSPAGALQDGSRHCVSCSTFASGHLLRTVIAGRKERKMWCVLDLAGLFPPYTWSAVVLGQGKKMSAYLCPLPESEFMLCHPGSSSVSLYLRCELWIVHAVELFREGLGSRVRILLPEGSGLLLLAGSWQTLTVEVSGREVSCHFSFRPTQALEPLF